MMANNEKMLCIDIKSTLSDRTRQGKSDQRASWSIANQPLLSLVVEQGPKISILYSSQVAIRDARSFEIVLMPSSVRKSQQTTHSLKLSGVGFPLFAVDAEYRGRGRNDKLVELTGYTLDDAQNAPIEPLFVFPN